MSKGTPLERVNWDAEWAELHSAIGLAISKWSRLEHALAKAFAISLGLPSQRTDRMFFAMHTFSAKRELLREAIHSNPLEPGIEATRQSVFKSACMKAEKYASTRNKLAHSQPAIAAHGSLVLGGIITSNAIGKDVGNILQKTITVKAIREAASSFGELAKLVNQACVATEQSSIETLLQQVRGLAPCPYSDSLGLRAAIEPEPPAEPSQA